jgi:hypothetical protein
VRSLPLAIGVSFTVHAAVFLAFRLPVVHTPPDLAKATVGDTFELPAPESADALLAPDKPQEDVVTSPPDGEILPPTKTAHRVDHGAKKRANPGSAKPATGAPSTPEATMYGAVGERGAVDIARAFTRDFPQAASADPLWRNTALGAAGTASVLLTLDEAGHLDSARVLGTPTQALAEGIRRTLALIKNRQFVARRKTTKLTVRASVSADTVHDGLHGDVFAIGGSYEGGAGNAFFALNVGRRIDVQVHEQL